MIARSCATSWSSSGSQARARAGKVCSGFPKARATKQEAVAPMTPGDFHFLARLVRRRSGLIFTESKSAVLERRLTPAMRRFGFRGLDALMRELRLGND